MALKGHKEVAPNRYELEISIDGEAFREAIRKAYQRGAKKMNVPGFRKGKAPLSVIEKYYGEEVFFEDALNILYPEALESAADEAGLKLLDDKIDFDLVSINKQDGAEYKLTVTTQPEIEIGEYKGLKAEKVKPSVAADEIAAELDKLVQRNSRLVSVEDRAAKEGDIAVIDYDGSVDGVPFAGGKGEGHSLTLGSGQFIPGFEEQVVGHKPEDAFDVEVTFPEDYHAEDLKGKKAVFTCKVHELKVRELPELDDEFAKDVSEFDTLKELKEDTKKKMLEDKDKQADADAEDAVISQLVDSFKGDIPQVMIDRRVEDSVRDFDYRLQMQGMNLQTYMQFTGGNLEEFRAGLVPQAERQVKVRLALEKIAENEKFEVADEELEAEFVKLAAQYGVDIKEVKKAIAAREVKADMLVSKAIAFVKDNAVITEVEAKKEAKKPAAKKPATKKTGDTEKAKKPAAKKPATKKPTKAKEEK